jgi:hypothetical protein
MWARDEQEMGGEHREKNDTKCDRKMFHEGLHQ